MDKTYVFKGYMYAARLTPEGKTLFPATITIEAPSKRWAVSTLNNYGIEQMRHVSTNGRRRK